MHASDHAKLFAMGAAAVQHRELQAAEQIFRSILQDDPSAHPAWNALAIVALQAGAAATAVEYALRAVELDRRNPLYLANLGIAQSELGELSAAEKALNRALKLKPVYPEALLYLGKVRQIVRLEGYVHCAAGFRQHPQVLNGASELINAVFGEKGRHTRTALGIHEMPLDAPVQIVVWADVE